MKVLIAYLFLLDRSLFQTITWTIQTTSAFFMQNNGSQSDQEINVEDETGRFY